MASHTFNSPQALQDWGKRWAKTLKAGDVVALMGDLGAGKTTLVQSVAAAWGYPHGATSPTFALVNEYATPKGIIYHMDMYRLSPKELISFPIEEYMHQGLCLIEWADRVAARLPAYTQSIRLQIRGPQKRTLIHQKKHHAS